MISVEPIITINGQLLSHGQAMAVRVACTVYHATLATETDPLGNDEHGRRMTKAYIDRYNEVLKLMIDGLGQRPGMTRMTEVTHPMADDFDDGHQPGAALGGDGGEKPA